MNEAMTSPHEPLAVLDDATRQTAEHIWDARRSPPGFSIADGHRLRVGHLSPSYGGVANAARQLHAGLLEIGVESRFWTVPFLRACQPGQGAWLSWLDRIGEFADRLSRRVDRHMGLTGMTHVTSLFRSYPAVDVLHFHGMDSSWFNLHALPRLDHRQPLVWTMHDKHLGTGACGFPEFWNACERWQIGCGRCPKVQAEQWWLDGTHWVHQRKKRLVGSTRMAIVAPSRWMFEFIATSDITRGQTLRVIPNGVDTNTFVPLSPGACRQELRLPQEGKLLLCVASKLDEPRKGLQYYEPLLRRLMTEYKDEVGLVLVGARLPEQIIGQLQAFMPVFSVGKIDDPRSLAKLYSACDALLVTSMIDNFPSVVLESMACGTPVAAFRVGGIPDMVVPGHTGILSEREATEDLAMQLGALFEAPEKLLAMRTRCRDRAVQEYSRTVQASNHLQLYRELCESRRSAQ